MRLIRSSYINDGQTKKCEILENFNFSGEFCLSTREAGCKRQNIAVLEEFNTEPFS